MSDDQASTVIGARYELHRRLAKGGMAMVYLGRDKALDRAVAVKILLKEFATDPKFVERFELEAKRAAKLGHPNIVGVYDWGRDGDTHYIVMEFVDGKSVSQMLRDGGPIGPDRAAEIASETAAGLALAHQNGTIHRDCKTGNIMVSHDGEVKIGDFGIATALSTGAASNLTQTGAVMGTATYFSPEQAQGKRLDQRSDLYSLGVVLYEMLGGKPPFRGDGPVAIAMKHVSEQPRPLREIKPDVPRELEAITMKLLAKNPDDRYPSAEDLMADLARFREGGHTLAAPGALASSGQATVPITDPSRPDGPPPAAAAAAAAPAGQIRIPASATRPPGPARPPVSAYGDEPPAVRYDEDPYDDEGGRPPWGYIAAVILLLGVLVALVILLLNTIGDDGTTETSEDPPATDGDTTEPVTMVDVPSLIGFTLEEAQAQLVASGLTFAIQTSERSDIPPGEVVAQVPASGNGAQLAEGSEVALTVSVAPPEPDDEPVPGVVGFTEEEAVETLTDAGFEPNVIGVESEEPPDTVVTQSPEEGIPATPGSTVDIEVSTGPGATEVPFLDGQTLEQARITLTDAGFNPLFLDGTSSTIAAGLVVSVQPAPGSLAERGSDVVVTISSGPAGVVVPNVVGQVAADAQARLERENLVVTPDTCLITNPDTQSPGTVLEQTPAAGSDALEGDSVVICVGVEPEPTPGGGDGGDGGDADGADGATGADDPPPTPPETIDDDG